MATIEKIKNFIDRLDKKYLYITKIEESQPTGYSDKLARLYASDLPHFSKLTIDDIITDYYETEELITIYRDLKKIYKDKLKFRKSSEYIRVSKKSKTLGKV